jgi:hypothetical protein
MLKQLLILVSLTSPLWVITASYAQVKPTEAEIREACQARQVEKLPSPYSDVSKEHWAYSAVASLYYCKSRGIFATAPVKAVTKLQTAPTKVNIDGRNYTLDAYVWRDFMPSIGKPNRGLMANVNLVAEDGEAIPAKLTLDKLWVINGSEIWETKPGNARSGPQWQPGAPVDVVAQIKGINGKTYLLRNPSQQIQATY